MTRFGSQKGDLVRVPHRPIIKKNKNIKKEKMYEKSK